jgi:hypothetical protein
MKGEETTGIAALYTDEGQLLPPNSDLIFEQQAINNSGKV